MEPAPRRAGDAQPLVEPVGAGSTLASASRKPTWQLTSHISTFMPVAAMASSILRTSSSSSIHGS